MDTKVIILAAGKGTRLQPLTISKHKCLTEVNGTPILLNTLSILSQYSVAEIVIVVGYLGKQIKETVGTSYHSVPIKYVENEIYDTTNTSYSLWCGLQKLGYYNKVLILEADVFFEAAVLHRLMKDSAPNATVLEKYNKRLDGTVVEVDECGFVVDWRHKTTQGQDFILSNKYKTVNIHRFSYEFVENELKEVVNRYVQDDKSAPMESAMRELVTDNKRLIKGIQLDGEIWAEIDDENDLKYAELIFCN